MGSADRAREYADMLEAVDLFNGEYLKGVESPRRPMLLARLKACLPVLEETLMELRAVGVGSGAGTGRRATGSGPSIRACSPWTWTCWTTWTRSPRTCGTAARRWPVRADANANAAGIGAYRPIPR